jgi:Ca2+-binding RTX toxin-like protein
MTKDFSKKLSQISGAQRAFDGLGDDLEGNGEDNFIFGGRGGDTIDGKGGNDMLYGGTDDDVIDGGPGHDYLLGGMGTDTMNGEVGNDILQGDATGDKMQDDGGPTDTDDVLSFASGGSPGFDKNMSAYPNFPSTPNQRGVYVDLSVKIANNGSVTDGGGTDKANDDPAQGTRFQDFEHVVGTPFADHIVGSTGVNVLQGGGGSDVIEGNGGGDVLFGDMGGDNLTATAGSWILGGVGEDYCAGTTVLVDCEPKPFNWVSQRDEGAISVGMTTQAWAGNVRSQLYLAGSTANWVTENGEDDVTVTQIPGSGSTPPTFTFSSSAATTQGQFSLDPEDQSPGCSYTATLVTCAPASNVTTLVLAGFGSNDRIDLSNVARMTSTIILGGDGHDDLWGGNYTEDFIVDGDGNDSLFGKAADDGLVNTGGTDDLWAAENDDLLLSNEVCTGDTLGGGAGIDSSSWAKFESESAIPAGSVHGVFASIFTGNIGKNVGAELSCSGAGPVGTFAGMEDLEGSKHWDVLRGDGGENQVLGRGTADQLRSYQGDDLIIANAGDLDNIDCGNQQDFSVIDFTQYGDERDNSCEGFDRRAPRFDQD